MLAAEDSSHGAGLPAAVVGRPLHLGRRLNDLKDMYIARRLDCSHLWELDAVLHPQHGLGEPGVRLHQLLLLRHRLVAPGGEGRGPGRGRVHLDPPALHDGAVQLLPAPGRLPGLPRVMKPKPLEPFLLKIISASTKLPYVPKNLASSP